MPSSGHDWVGRPVASYETERLPPFFAIFLFREAAAAAAAAAAETKQLELVAAARAAIAIKENFMVVSFVDYNRSARVTVLCLLVRIIVQLSF